MGIFDKLGKKAVPEWASFMSGEEFDRFIELTEDDLRGRGARFARKDGVIAVAARGASALPPGNYRLGSLAQMCHQMEQSEWPVGIARHFDMAIQGVDAAEELSAIAHDYGRVKPLLRVRIYPPGWTQSKEGLLVRHDIPGLDTVLCFDLPTMVFPASRVYSARWGVSVEAAFEDGIANSTELDEIQKEDIPIAGMELKGFVGQPVWHTTHALKLEQLAGPAGQYGALVGLPNRHVILVHNITDGDMPGLIGDMGRLTRDLYEEGPGSLSSDLYWHIDGGFERIPVEISIQGMPLATPAPTFVERVMRPLGFEMGKSK